MVLLFFVKHIPYCAILWYVNARWTHGGIHSEMVFTGGRFDGTSIYSLMYIIFLSTIFGSSTNSAPGPRPFNKQLLGQLSDWNPSLSDASVWSCDPWFMKHQRIQMEQGSLKNHHYWWETWIIERIGYWIGRLRDWQLAVWSILMVFVNETAWFFLFQHGYSMPTHDQALINKDFELLTAPWNEVPDGAVSGSFLRSNSWTQGTLHASARASHG